MKSLKLSSSNKTKGSYHACDRIKKVTSRRRESSIMLQFLPQGEALKLKVRPIILHQY